METERIIKRSEQKKEDTWALEDIFESNEKWFEELKVIGAELGYCANRKEYKANPENYKGMISDVAGAVRSALSHRTNTPDLYTIMQIMGEEKVRERFNKFLAL